MDHYDLIFLLIIGAFVAWQLLLMIRAHRQIKIVTDAPGRIGGAVICVVILAVAIYRRGNFATAWPIYLGIVLMMSLYLFARVGLTENGFFSTSRYIPYSSLQFYAIDMPEAPKCRLRLARSAGRESIMIITQAQKGQVEAWLINAGVPTFQSYSEEVRKRKN